MEYHNLQTENNYNYPIFNADNNFNAKKPNNCYNIPLQIQDKNDLKESLLSKDNYIEEYKQSSFNYIHPKQTGEYNIKDIQFYDNKCNNFVESKENQINLINNDINQQLPKKTYISSNYVIKNEISSLEGANNIPAQQSFQLNQDSNQHQSIPIVNYSFNNNQNKSISQNNNYNQNINYNPCFNNTNYKPVGSSMNSVNYQIPTPSNYSFQPQSILNNNNKINSNVVSYSFNNPNSDVTNISEDNSINNVNPKAKIDQASKNDQNTKPVIPNYQQIEYI